MPALTAETTDYRLDIDADQRCHWIVGRDPSCELKLDDRGISRFHATIFHIGGEFNVIDHSLNGSHVFRDQEEFRRALSLPMPPAQLADPDVVGFETCEVVRTEFRTPTINGEADADAPIDCHLSHAELRLQQLKSDVSKLPGHKSHTIVSDDLMQPILDMIYGDEAETLASMARKVKPGNVLLFIGHDRHYFRFEE